MANTTDFISAVYDEIHLSGANAGNLKTAADYTNADAATSPASARAVKVNFTPAADSPLAP